MAAVDNRIMQDVFVNAFSVLLCAATGLTSALLFDTVRTSGNVTEQCIGRSVCGAAFRRESSEREGRRDCK